MKDHVLRSSVRWGDGTHDSSKTCSECGLDTCKYPVHNDYYKVISSKTAKKFEAETFQTDLENLAPIIDMKNTCRDDLLV